MRLRQAALLACTLVFAAPAVASQKAENIAITPASKGAVLIVRAPILQTEYSIGISRFDPVESNLLTGTFSGGWADVLINDRLARDGYLVRTIKPGTYVIRDVSQQSAWGVCFHAASLQFEVKAGEVIYLGEFDGRTPMTELQGNAIGRGNLVARSGTLYHYFDEITPPRFAAADADLDGVRSFVAQHMPKTRATPRAVAFAPAMFGTGSDLFGAQRICGGYHKKKVGETAQR